MSNLIISEEQYKRLFEKKEILTEADSRLKKLEQIIRQSFNGVLDPDAQVTESDYYVNHNPNTTWLQYIAFSFRHTFDLMLNSDVKFIPEFARIAFFDLNFEKQNSDGEGVEFIQRVVGLCKSNIELFQKYVVGQNYQSVYQAFEPIISEQDKEEQERINNADYSQIQSEYEILEDVDYETANKIGDYSSPEGPLCYTQSFSTWSDYTKGGGLSVYIFLKNGWRNIPPKHTEQLIDVRLDDHGDGSAYDAYGLSMIFAFISGSGKLVYCNTRWNHDADYAVGMSCDHALTKEQLSYLIGKPIDSVCKPMTNENVLERANHLYTSDTWDVYQASNGRVRYCFITMGEFDDNETYYNRNVYMNINKQTGDKVLFMCTDSGYMYVQVNDKSNSISTWGTKFTELAPDWGFDGDIINFYINLTYEDIPNFAETGLAIHEKYFVQDYGNHYVSKFNSHELLNTKPFDDYYRFDDSEGHPIGIKVTYEDGSQNIFTANGPLVPENERVKFHDTNKLAQNKYIIVTLESNYNDYIIDITTNETFFKEEAYNSQDYYITFGSCSEGTVRVSKPSEQDEDKDAYNIYNLQTKQFLLPEFRDDLRPRETFNHFLIVRLRKPNKGSNVLNLNTMQLLLPENTDGYTFFTNPILPFKVNFTKQGENGSYTYSVTEDGMVYVMDGNGIRDLQGNEYISDVEDERVIIKPKEA